MFEAINPLECPLNGWNLVEASAGTGKTYTLTSLYARLIAEQGLLPEQILTVTFTRAATAELKQRISQRLFGLLKALQSQDNSADEAALAAALISNVGDHQTVTQRIRLALGNLDAAAVFTIDGFCQRLLSERPLASGLPMQLQIETDEIHKLVALILPGWQANLAQQDPRLASYLLEQQRATPHWLATRLRPYVWQTNVQQREVAPVDIPLHEDWLRAFDHAHELWLNQSADLCNWLLEKNSPTNKRSYTKRNVPNWQQKVSDWFANPDNTWSGESLDRFAKSTINIKGEPDAVAWPPLELPDALDALVQCHETMHAALQQAAIHWEQNWLRQLAELSAAARCSSGALGYGELKYEVAAALQGPHSDSIVQSVRRDFRAALIDEFQDTDPLQYTIFDQLFHAAGRSCFLVGDPKQSIYRFRGADVYAYLHASDHADKVYTLNDNWRSTPQMIEAANSLFQAKEHVFIEEKIQFQAASAADKPRDQGHFASALQYIVQESPDGKRMKKNQSQPGLANQAAAAIAALIDKDDCAAGDIAVLVRNHNEAGSMADALRQYGIPYLRTERDSVFATNEADQLRFILQAMVDPRRLSSVRAALASRLLSLNAETLLSMSDEREADYIEDLYQARELWLYRGIGAAVMRLLEAHSSIARLRAAQDGERSLTNVLHLLDLLQQAEREHHYGPADLLNWLRQRQHEAGQDSETAEEHLLRLESDAERVQIQTIHKSKGLQYSVVVLPFVGLGRKASPIKQPTTVHIANETRLLWPEQFSEAETKRLIQEEQAEDMRLSYVAITRAVDRCILGLADCDNFECSMLGLLLNNFSIAQQWLQQHAQVAEELSESLARSESASPQSAAKARVFNRELQHIGQTTSFSALAQGAYDQPQDHDQAAADSANVIFTPGHNRHGLPRGAVLGQAVHHYLEHWQPQSGAEDAAASLRAFGIAEQWADVLQQMGEDVMYAPLMPGQAAVTLAAIPKQRKRPELAFDLRLSALRPGPLHKLLSRHGYAHAITGFGELPPGYLRGFIDLVFEHEQKFYLVDYKSNWLGPHDKAYGSEQLAGAIASGHYALQYLLYTVAVHRWLQHALPDYQYETHFGGALYLFVRGMSRDAESGQGVFFDRPSESLINELEALLDREILPTIALSAHA